MKRPLLTALTLCSICISPCKSFSVVPSKLLVGSRPLTHRHSTLIGIKPHTVLHASSKLSSKGANSEDVQAGATEIEQTLIKQDGPIYLGLLALQFLPLVSTDRLADLLYFGVVACTTVYLAAKRQDIPNFRTAISTKQAGLAPVLSSVSLFGLYLLIKYSGFDPSALYQYSTTAFGVLTAGGIGGALLAAALPASASEKRFPLPDWLTNLFKDPEAPSSSDATVGIPGILATVFAVCGAAAYLNPGVIDLHHTFIFANFLAWCIGMEAIGLITIQSFTTACVLLGGLFCYDIYWVFATDVMQTVATSLEAPVKLIFPLAGEGMKRAYPYAVLGLGDIVIPATVIALLRNIDRALAKEDSGGISVPLGEVGRPGKLSYFLTSAVAYALGLSLCFGANVYFHTGQPALLYLCPAVIFSALGVAQFNGGEFDRLFGYRSDTEVPELTED